MTDAISQTTDPGSRQDPFALFQAWYDEAQSAEPGLAEAMVLATVAADRSPSARVVLLKGHDARGFCFYTNMASRKGDEIDANPQVALCFHWKSIGRQVRIEGAIQPVDPTEADAYFAIRPRGSQLGAWASHQSEALPSRDTLRRRIDEFEVRFASGQISRPPFWSGYRVVPSRIEFWRHGDDRLHERLAFDRAADRTWTTQYLYP